MQLGIEDPIAWRYTIDDELIDYWLAYYQLEPFGGDWIQTAHISAEINHLADMYAKDNRRNHQRIKWTGFMPTDYEKPKKRKPQPKMMQLVTGEQGFAMMKGHFS